MLRNSPASSDMVSIPGLGRFPRGGDGYLPGASTGDPIHDKVIQKRPDRQGRSGLEGLPGPAQASIPKPKSVCLLFTILCSSPTLLTSIGGSP